MTTIDGFDSVIKSGEGWCTGGRLYKKLSVNSNDKGRMTVVWDFGVVVNNSGQE